MSMIEFNKNCIPPHNSALELLGDEAFFNAQTHAFFLKRKPNSQNQPNQVPQGAPGDISQFWASAAQTDANDPTNLSVLASDVNSPLINRAKGICSIGRRSPYTNGTGNTADTHKSTELLERDVTLLENTYSTGALLDNAGRAYDALMVCKLNLNMIMFQGLQDRANNNIAPATILAYRVQKAALSFAQKIMDSNELKFPNDEQFHHQFRLNLVKLLIDIVSPYSNYTTLDETETKKIHQDFRAFLHLNRFKILESLKSIAENSGPDLQIDALHLRNLLTDYETYTSATALLSTAIHYPSQQIERWTHHIGLKNTSAQYILLAATLSDAEFDAMVLENQIPVTDLISLVSQDTTIEAERKQKLLLSILQKFNTVDLSAASIEDIEPIAAALRTTAANLLSEASSKKDDKPAFDKQKFLRALEIMKKTPASATIAPQALYDGTQSLTQFFFQRALTEIEGAGLENEVIMSPALTLVAEDLIKKLQTTKPAVTTPSQDDDNAADSDDLEVYRGVYEAAQAQAVKGMQAYYEKLTDHYQNDFSDLPHELQIFLNQEIWNSKPAQKLKVSKKLS